MKAYTSKPSKRSYKVGHFFALTHVVYGFSPVSVAENAEVLHRWPNQYTYVSLKHKYILSKKSKYPAWKKKSYMELMLNVKL